jgi:hypothetical protein
VTAPDTQTRPLAPILAALSRRGVAARAVEFLTQYRRQCLDDESNIGEPSMRLPVEKVLYAKGDAHVYIPIKELIDAIERHRSGL